MVMPWHVKLIHLGLWNWSVWILMVIFHLCKWWCLGMWNWSTLVMPWHVDYILVCCFTTSYIVTMAYLITPLFHNLMMYSVCETVSWNCALREVASFECHADLAVLETPSWNPPLRLALGRKIICYLVNVRARVPYSKNYPAGCSYYTINLVVLLL